MMAQHHGALCATQGPIATGAVFARREGRTVCLGACQNVVHVGLVATAIHLFALFIERCVLVEIIAVVQFGNILGYHFALGVGPWPRTNAVLGV